MKKTTKPAAAERPAVAEEIAALMGSNGENIDAAVKANEALTSGMAAWGQEVMGFANRRLSENLKCSESLLQCRDAGQALDLNVAYAQRAAEQYLEEVNKLFGLATRISRDCWAPLEKQTKVALHEINGD